MIIGIMRALTVAEMMTTGLKVLYEDESVSAADWDMVVGEFRHMPVVDRDQRLVGLVSDRDVMRTSPQRSTSVSQPPASPRHVPTR